MASFQLILAARFDRLSLFGFLFLLRPDIGSSDRTSHTVFLSQGQRVFFSPPLIVSRKQESAEVTMRLVEFAMLDYCPARGLPIRFIFAADALFTILTLR